MVSLEQSRLNQSLNVSMAQVDVEELSTAGSAVLRLRAACVLYCRNDLVSRRHGGGGLADVGGSGLGLGSG